VPVDVDLSVQQRGPITVHTFDAFADLGVDGFVTERAGGVSVAPYDSLNLGVHVGDDPACVEENRCRVADAVHVARDCLVTARQVHGDDVVMVEGPVEDLSADGLVTDSSSVALAVLVADCVPLLIVDASSPRIAVVHAGWRGLTGGVVARALSYFPQPATLEILVGPAVSPARYQVGPEVAAHFSDVPGAVTPDESDRRRLDLRRVASHQLRVAGVRDDHIFITRAVTDGGERFFSDRAQRPSGRFALVARRT
jgi:YfiH family protein